MNKLKKNKINTENCSILTKDYSNVRYKNFLDIKNIS